MPARCATASLALAASTASQARAKAKNHAATQAQDAWQALPLAERDRIATAELRKLMATATYGTPAYFALLHAECALQHHI